MGNRSGLDLSYVIRLRLWLGLNWEMIESTGLRRTVQLFDRGTDSSNRLSYIIIVDWRGWAVDSRKHLLFWLSLEILDFNMFLVLLGIIHMLYRRACSEHHLSNLRLDIIESLI
jgi:hypothetical protein